MSVLVTKQAPDFTSAAVLADGSIVDDVLGMAGKFFNKK